MNSLDRKLMPHGCQPEPVREPPPMTLGEPDMAEQLELLAKVRRLPDIRFEKVQEMRELIARGEFETPERIEGTARRLMEELGL